MRKPLYLFILAVAVSLLATCVSTGPVVVVNPTASRAVPDTVEDLSRVTPTPTVPSQPSRARAAEPLPAPTPYLDASELRTVRVYQEIGPSVVNITTRVLEYSFFYGVIPSEGAGSGFLWDREGHIVTNYHVVEGAQSVEVSFSADEVLPARVVGVDPPNDLAVVQVARIPEGLIPLSERLGDSDRLLVGQRTIAIGNPFGRFDRTLTTGVVSALGRTIEVEGGRRLRRVIQTDAAINRGNSGGPLLDANGYLIGVNSAIFSPTGTSAGIGFAIPVNTVKRVVPVLIREGRYPHPWLGAVGYAITPRLARALKLPVDQGLLVAQIYRNSPAHKAGLRGATRRVIVGNRRLLIGGDIITAVDDQPVRDWDELEDYLELETQVGDTVTLTILRDRRELTLEVVLEEAPQ